jgi:hypothetical protein
MPETKKYKMMIKVVGKNMTAYFVFENKEQLEILIKEINNTISLLAKRKEQKLCHHQHDENHF